MIYAYNKLIGGAFHNYEAGDGPITLTAIDKETGKYYNLDYSEAVIQVGDNIAKFHVMAGMQINFSSLANQIRFAIERHKTPFDKAVEDVLSKIE